MKMRLLTAAFALAGLLGSAQAFAQNAYITNSGSNTVSVINTGNNTVIATIPVESFPLGVAVNPISGRVYIGNSNSGTVSVIDTATNEVSATITVGTQPDLLFVLSSSTRGAFAALVITAAYGMFPPGSC
jgi:YVTN family beta-propeller protein